MGTLPRPSLRSVCSQKGVRLNSLIISIAYCTDRGFTISAQTTEINKGLGFRLSHGRKSRHGIPSPFAETTSDTA